MVTFDELRKYAGERDSMLFIKILATTENVKIADSFGIMIEYEFVDMQEFNISKEQHFEIRKDSCEFLRFQFLVGWSSVCRDFRWIKI